MVYQIDIHLDENQIIDFEVLDWLVESVNRMA